MDHIWQSTKNAIKSKIPEHSFRMWIEPLLMNNASKNEAYIISCPNTFSKKRVEDNFGKLIISELNKITKTSCKLSFEVNTCQTQPQTTPKRTNIEKPAYKQLVIPQTKNALSTGRLLRRGFTFNNFVVGDNNNFAYSAARYIASKDQTNQNAMYLLSGTGMGKSHLSQAVGHHILDQFPKERVLYITAEDFANEMIRAFQTNAIDQFKTRFRTHCDVLLLEDVQFLAGKERTQIELALAIDYLFEMDKKIIFTSSYLPKDIPKLSEQLRSRLICGLLSEIDPPDFQTRVRILQKKAMENGYRIPHDVMEYLAGELSKNVRQLESGLIGVASKSTLLSAPISLNLAQSVVKTIVEEKKHLTIEAIQKVVSLNYSISIEDMVSKSRKKNIVRPRQIAIYLARKYTDKPLQAIGKDFNRKHATAMHSIATIERELKTDSQIKKQVDYLIQKLETSYTKKS